MECFEERSKRIPVIASVDVLVAGAGPAGLAAALSVKEKVDLRDLDVSKIQAKAGI